MEKDNSQDMADLNQDSFSGEDEQVRAINEKVEEADSIKENMANTVSKTYNCSQSQLGWMNRQVRSLERELLLNNLNSLPSSRQISNWTKVILTAIACIIPGIGQIIGIILGLLYVSSDTNSDKRSFGAALLTVSIIAFTIISIFWFMVFVSFGPQLYY